MTDVWGKAGDITSQEKIPPFFFISCDVKTQKTLAWKMENEEGVESKGGRRSTRVSNSRQLRPTPTWKRDESRTDESMTICMILLCKHVLGGNTFLRRKQKEVRNERGKDEHDMCQNKVVWLQQLVSAHAHLHIPNLVWLMGVQRSEMSRRGMKRKRREMTDMFAFLGTKRATFHEVPQREAELTRR